MFDCTNNLPDMAALMRYLANLFPDAPMGWFGAWQS
jgi:hypothetical protein